jgi:hypothetical protein
MLAKVLLLLNSRINQAATYLLAAKISIMRQELPIKS